MDASGAHSRDSTSSFSARPTVDLVLKILCSSRAQWLAMCRYFEGEGPLFEWGALHFVPSGGTDDLRLSRQLRLDPVVTGFLIGQRKLDRRLRGFCTEVTPSWSVTDVPVPETARELLARTLPRARNGEPLRIHLQGPDGSGHQPCAEALASGLDARLLIANLSTIPPDEHHASVGLALLHARLFGQVPCFRSDATAIDGRLNERLSNYPGMIALHGWQDSGTGSAFRVSVDLDLPTCEQRRAYWSRQLNPFPSAVEPPDLDALAARFELSFHQIRAAAFDATCGAQAMGRAPTTTDLMDAARRHSSRDLASMSDIMEPSRRWCDLVLPDESLTQLRELCDRVRRRHRVLQQWGFGRERRGTGVNALFVGTSGTGKTLAAEVIAAELGLNLYRIDLARVVSKYIGETEKNLERIFQAAERSNAVLLFDEADALFGKRSIVRDAHDRYANVEISYLLQRLESYPGVSILTTNLSENLDQAFTRRLAYRVHFPLPGPAERQRIWEAVWPPQAPPGCRRSVPLASGALQAHRRKHPQHRPGGGLSGCRRRRVGHHGPCAARSASRIPQAGQSGRRP